MDQNHEASLQVRNSSEVDGFGVSWGEELPPSTPEDKSKHIKQYTSFYLDGTKYCQNDTVYFLSGDGDPYIGRIGNLYENVKKKEKQMHVRWFCRPSELPEGLPDVNYGENCREVFLMWGNGAKNVNNPASIVKKCSILCTAEETWNHSPSIEEITKADQFFDRAFDVSTGTLRSLDVIVKQYGEHHVIGTGGSIRLPGKRVASRSCEKSAASCSNLDRESRPPAASRSGLPKLKIGGQSSEFLGVPSVTSPSNSNASQKSKEARTIGQKAAQEKILHQGGKRPKAVGEKAILKPVFKDIKRARVKPVRYDSKLDSQKKPRVDKADALLPQLAQERLIGSKIPSPNVVEGRKRALTEPTTILSIPHKSSKPKSLEVMKKSREDSFCDKKEKSKVERSKLCSPCHILAVELPKAVIKEKCTHSPSMAFSPNNCELRAPVLRSSTVPERNLPEICFGWQQVQGLKIHQSPTNQENDSRVSSPPVGDSLSSRVSDKTFCYLDTMRSQMQDSPRTRLVEEENHDVKSFLQIVEQTLTTLDDKDSFETSLEEMCSVTKQSTKEKIHDDLVGLSSRDAVYSKDSVKDNLNLHLNQQVGEDLSNLHQNGGKCIDGELDRKLGSKSSADGLDRRGKLSMKNSVGVSIRLPKGPKLSTSKDNIVLSDEGVLPTFKKKKFAEKENRDDKLGESHGKLLSAGEPSPFSKNAELFLQDVRHGEVWSFDKAVQQRPSSELDVSTLRKKDMQKCDFQPLQREAKQGPEEIKLKNTGLVGRSVPGLSSKKRPDETRSDEVPILFHQELVGRVIKHRVLEPGLVTERNSHAPVHEATFASLDDHQRDKFEPKKKIFNFPWEQSLRIALEQRKALLLQNLDPLFSSPEIEAMLEKLLHVTCDVRMLPPKNFTCYTSGEALVLFRNQNAAEEALELLTENWLIWSQDGRPVLASIADEKMKNSGHIHGFYNSEVLRSRALIKNGSEDQKNAVATSHCSQPNTVEYEMGIQWRLLQNRHTEAWTLAAQDQRATIDKCHLGSVKK